MNLVNSAVADEDDVNSFIGLLLQSPTYGFNDSEDCYILFVLFLQLFSTHRFFNVPEPIFSKLCHTTRYVLKLIMHYGVFIYAPEKFWGKNPIFASLQTRSRH